MKTLGIILMLASLLACSEEETGTPRGVSPDSLTKLTQFVDQPGLRASTCPRESVDSDSVDLPVDASLSTGQVVASAMPGAVNCFRVDSTVALANDPAMKLQVVKVEVIPWQLLQEEHAEAVGVSLADLQTQLWQDIVEELGEAAKTTSQVNITYFVKMEPLLQPESTQ